MKKNITTGGSLTTANTGTKFSSVISQERTDAIEYVDGKTLEKIRPFTIYGVTDKKFRNGDQSRDVLAFNVAWKEKGGERITRVFTMDETPERRMIASEVRRAGALTGCRLIKAPSGQRWYWKIVGDDEEVESFVPATATEPSEKTTTAVLNIDDIPF